MLKQIFLVNTDLKMNKGKIAVQVAHGEVLYIEDVLEGIFAIDDTPSYENYMKWRGFGSKYGTESYPIGTMLKIVKKATEKEINDILQELALKGIKVYSVYDLGYTQVAPNSFTCICVEPLEEDICNELFGKFKLL